MIHNLFYFFAATDPKDADIIWTSMQIDEDTRKAAGITDQQYINQFPFEACLVMKHHLAETVQKVKISNFCFTWVIAPPPKKNKIKKSSMKFVSKSSLFYYLI